MKTHAQQRVLIGGCFHGLAKCGFCLDPIPAPKPKPCPACGAPKPCRCARRGISAMSLFAAPSTGNEDWEPF